MNYAEKLASRLVREEIVFQDITEDELISVIITEAKKEIEPKTLKYWLLSDTDFLSDAVSTVYELLKKDMKKIFNVVAGMDKMSHDQLKGAVRNMESISNAMYVTLEEMLKEYLSTPGDVNVMTLTFDQFMKETKELILPATDGHDVIVTKLRPDLLMEWKLRFFAKYGNLNLTCTFQSGDTAQLKIEEYNNAGNADYYAFAADRMERERSDAALYKSMSNTKF